MANTAFDGPLSVYGNLANIPAGFVSDTAVPDPNQDAGPSKFFQGVALLDPRYIYPKDRVTGWTGVEQAVLDSQLFRTISQIPAALGAAVIVPAAHPASGVAMTLATRATGVEVNIPIRPMTQVPSALNASSVVTAALALDFGFAWGNVTSGSKTITVASANDFILGMPLVIAGVGNSAGTAPLLTYVTAITPATPSITVADAPAATLATAAIGTGDLWGPNEIPAGYPEPKAAYPFVAGGPGLFLDPRQCVARGVSVTGLSSGTGGVVTVAGWDIYGQPMSEAITLAAGANVVYGKKCFKYIGSVTPNFSDTINVSVGTSDNFGFGVRAGLWEDTDVCWAGGAMTASTGYTLPDATSPATSTTGDVRGTIQVSASGPLGGGIGTNASNGTVVSLAMSGRRLMMASSPSPWSIVGATQANPVSMFGVQQA